MLAQVSYKGSQKISCKLIYLTFLEIFSVQISLSAHYRHHPHHPTPPLLPKQTTHILRNRQHLLLLQPPSHKL